MGYQSRYPLANVPGSEFQGMNYKDWMNRCANGELGELFVDTNALRNGVVAGLAITSYILSVSFPMVSAAVGIISVLLPILWPEQAGPPGTTEAQFTWDQWMQAAEELVDQRVESVVKDLAIEGLKSLQSSISDYNRAICNLKTDPSDERLKERVRIEFNDADDKAKEVMIRLGNPRNAVPLLADYAQAANLHLLLLRDAVKFGESWGFTALEVQQYYFNNEVGNPGLKQLLATYTDHCVRYYNEGLQKRYETGDWYTFNDYRRNMTLMVMDIVSVWPTYDPMLYKFPTKSQLTRTVYKDFLRDTIRPPAISDVENSVTVPLGLFRWIRGLGYHGIPVNGSNVWNGLVQSYQYTLGDSLYEERKGEFLGNPELLGYLAVPLPTVGDDVWSIIPNYYPIESSSGYIPNTAIFFHDFRFQLLKSEEQRVSIAYEDGISRKFGLPCKSNHATDCDPCQPCTELPNASDPCDDKSLYSHRFSHMGILYTTPTDFTLCPCFGWTHVSADANNLIDAEKITQIPAVKACELQSDATVIKGPGSTGGDLVQLYRDGSFRIRLTGQVQKGYRLRIRYALPHGNFAQLNIYRYVNIDGSWQRDFGSNLDTETTYYSGKSLQYNSFGYATMFYSLPPSPSKDWDMYFKGYSYGAPLIIDKIEFIPIEGS
ncbi:insecticidal delta-endotoxin Cry8Ea1 family protein, partial [Bacillus cereus]